MEGCYKAYGCEGSLNQHIKIKHPSFYCTQFAKMPHDGDPADDKEGDMDESGKLSDQT